MKQRCKNSSRCLQFVILFFKKNEKNLSSTTSNELYAYLDLDVLFSNLQRTNDNFIVFGFNENVFY